MPTLNVLYGDHDPERDIVFMGFDGRSQPIYLYRDELSLPDWDRTHIIKEV